MNVNLKKQITGRLEDVVEQVKLQFLNQGFSGICRIDLHEAVMEKIHKHIHPTVIISACHPELSYEAYQANADISSLLPCTGVIREVNFEIMSVELERPTFFLSMIGERKLAEHARELDRRLQHVIDSLEDATLTGSSDNGYWNVSSI